MPPKCNLIGQTFGLLTVVAEITGQDRVKWLCRCVCGQTTITQTSNLTNNHTRSCRRCIRIKYNEPTATNPLYKIWAVRVCSKHGCCSAWRNYEIFRAWAIDNGWRQGLWVHRKADQGEYAPENCFIASRRLQGAYGQSQSTKLLPTDIPLIFQLADGGLTPVEIGAKFNADSRTIRDVLNGVTWKNVDVTMKIEV
jgi:hypothetical protein